MSMTLSDMVSWLIKGMQPHDGEKDRNGLGSTMALTSTAQIVIEYPLVIKHGTGKWTISVIFLIKPPFIGDFPLPCLMTPEGKSHETPLNHHFPMVFL